MQPTIVFFASLVFLFCNIFVQGADAIEADELKSILNEALEKGDRKINEKLDLILRLAVATADVDGKTALHLWVVSNGTEKDILTIIDSGINVNAVDKQLGRTSLHFAAGEGNEKMVEILIKNEANVNAQDVEGNTPIMLALSNGYENVGDLLAKNGANYSITTNTGYSLLHLAVAKKNEKLIDAVIACECVDVNAKAMADMTPLMYAAKQNDSFVAIVEKLIENGADPGAKATDDNTSLHMAVAHGNVEIVKALINHGANVNAKGIYEQTPAEQLKRKGNAVPHSKEILEILKNAEAIKKED